MKSQTSLTGYGKRIVIKPARSRIIILLITSIHVGALFVLLFVDLNPWLLLAAAGLIVFNLRQHFSKEKTHRHGLSLQLGESILLQTDSSTWQEIDVLESFVTSWLVVLRVRTLNDSKKHSLVYAVDSMNTLSFRRLRIYLNLLILASSTDV